ncbi:MAG: hypothetical protein ACTII7_07730 [Galactobacter sp.]
MRTCGNCGCALGLARADARYCSTRCRVAGNRARRKAEAVVPAQMPESMTGRRRWCRADGKRPITTSGSPASSTKPYTWVSHAEVVASSAGDGMGIMLGDGIGCLDLDHCLIDGRLTPAAAEVLDALAAPILFMEVSMSGTGVHVFTAEPEAPGIEREWGGHYSRARFIRTTGKAFTRD